MPKALKTEYGASFKVDFDKRYAIFTAVNKTFSHRAIEHMNARGWNATIFSERTGLSSRLYYYLQENEMYNPDFDSVLAVCVGLRLSERERTELFGLAGYSFSNSKRHFTITYILNECNIKNIDDFNAAYMALRIDGPNTKPPLKSFA